MSSIVYVSTHHFKSFIAPLNVSYMALSLAGKTAIITGAGSGELILDLQGMTDTNRVFRH